jgi:3-oxoacyl-[acyl-carrier protein] reductase
MASEKRVALVTGGGVNIGRAIVLELAKAGHDVVINGRRNRDTCEAVKAEAEALGVAAHVAMGDVGQVDGSNGVIAAAMDRFGRIDVLVNNAAIRPEKPFLELTDEDWAEVMDVNFGGTMRLCRGALPGMVERGWGRIINFTGMNAMHGYNGRSHVSASKHAVWGLTKSLAKEYGPKGISTNVISPGPIDTVHDDNPAMTAHVRGQVSKIPLGRLGKPEEIAAATAYLASEGGAFCNGQMIQVNGGTQT